MVNNFLSVLIRTHKRPKFLRRCLDSLDKQTNKNFVIILISDFKGDNIENIISEYPNLSFMIKHVEYLGFPLCNMYFNEVKNMVNSDYVIFIDDDDEVIDNIYFDALENISIKKPAVIMSKMLFPNNRVIPEDQYWNKFPVRKHIGSLNFCVRSDIFKKFDWPAVRAGDYHFISAIFKNIDWKKDVYWYNKITTSVTHIGQGSTELR